MERINEEDVDVYLQQMERAFATPPERDKRQESGGISMDMPCGYRMHSARQAGRRQRRSSGRRTCRTDCF